MAATVGRAKACTVTACVVVAVPQLLVTVYVMVVLPVATPVTTPVLLLTVALAGVLLVHVPPDVASVRESAVPTHTAEPPEMIPAFGNGLTVKPVVAEAVPQPKLLVTV